MHFSTKSPAFCGLIILICISVFIKAKSDDHKVDSSVGDDTDRNEQSSSHTGPSNAKNSKTKNGNSQERGSASSKADRNDQEEKDSESDSHDWPPRNVSLSDSPSKWPGHLRPLGSVGAIQAVEVHRKFPKPQTFFSDHVAQYSPVLMRNASQKWAAYSKWQDDKYFLGLPQALTLWVNTIDGNITFRSFVEKYRLHPYILDEEVPIFLRDDVLMPTPLMCGPYYSLLSSHGMWMAWHGVRLPIQRTDKDVIRCVVSGRQDVVLINPLEFADKMPKKFGLVDVDRVDFEKFPTLREVAFLKATLEAGSCLFLPTKWFWQAGTQGRTISVDIAWDHAVKKLEKNDCDSYDTLPSLMPFEFKDLKSKGTVRQDAAVHYFASYLIYSPKYNHSEFEQKIKNDSLLLGDMTAWTDEFEEVTADLFSDLDLNKDMTFTLADLETLTPGGLPHFSQQLEDRLLDLEEIMNDQQAEVKAKAKASQKEPPGKAAGGLADKEHLQEYIDKYAKAIENVITESLEELAATGSLPDLQSKLRTKQQELGIEGADKAGSGKTGGQGTKAEKPKSAREQARAKIDAARAKKEKAEKAKEEGEEFAEAEDHYTVVDEAAVEEIMAEDEDLADTGAKTDKSATARGKSSKGTKKPSSPKTGSSQKSGSKKSGSEKSGSKKSGTKSSQKSQTGKSGAKPSQKAQTKKSGADSKDEL